MVIKSTTSAFQSTLAKFVFDKPTSFSEDFAQARFFKKFQVPSASNDDLTQQCWDEWLSFDSDLPFIRMPPGVWYRARLLLQEIRPVHFGEIQFPSGSEFYSTRGYNSLQSRLDRSHWSVTRDVFSHFARICYSHKALKRAVRYRYRRWFRKGNFDVTIRGADAFLYRKFRHLGSGCAFAIFSWKLERIVRFVNGSRFTTVPKNNTQERPINIEPFANIVVQRCIGLHFKKELKRLFGVDLENLQDVHRRRIASSEVATIDLKNASDAVSTSLCEFLLPKSVYRSLLESRCGMVLGLDGNYHLTKKISSMGNGFTFELMSIILTSVCRTLDPEATVFGDDIIISKTKATELIECLEPVGFVVNRGKSFIEGPFRESCGGNYHDSEGYIESYDFKYPENIHDCVVLLNKARVLGTRYPSFHKLFLSLQRCVPSAFCSGIEAAAIAPSSITVQRTPVLDSFFRTERECKERFLIKPKVKKKITKILRELHYHEVPKYFLGLSYKPKLASKTVRSLSSSNWAKYEMYLHSGMVTADNLTGVGDTVPTLYVKVGPTYFRVKDLTKAYA